MRACAVRSLEDGVEPEESVLVGVAPQGVGLHRVAQGADEAVAVGEVAPDRDEAIARGEAPDARPGARQADEDGAVGDGFPLPIKL